MAEIEQPTEELTFWGKGDGPLWTFEKTDLHDGAVIVADRGTIAREVSSDVRTYICTVRIYYNGTLLLSPCTEVLPPTTSTPAPTGTPMPTLISTETPISIPSDTPTTTPLPTAVFTPNQTATNTPVPTPTEIPTPTYTPVPTATATPIPTPTPIVSDLCAFHIQPVSGVSLRPFSRPEECEYIWQDEFNLFDVQVSVHYIPSRSTFEEKVVRWTELHSTTAGTQGIPSTQIRIGYKPIVEESQHGHSYYETFGFTGRGKPPFDNFCPTVFISRFFELGDPDDSLLRVSAVVCERHWEESRYQDRITSILDSFHPVPYGEQ